MTDKSDKPKKTNLDNLPFLQLLDNLAHSTTELEKTWSESLDSDSVQKSHAELITLWESFTRNLPSWSEAQALKLKDLGYETTIAHFPLNDDDFKAFSIATTPIERYKQLSIASFYQLPNVLNALQAIKEPTYRETSLPSGDIESWWEAGAFSQIRTSIRSLAFTLRQQLAVYEELINEPHRTVVRPISFHYLDTLRVLLNNDMFEAIPSVLIGAIRYTLAERTNIAIEKLPADLGARLCKLDDYSSLGYLYEQLDKLRLLIGINETPDRGYLVPLVIGCVMQLENLHGRPLNPKLIEELKV